MDPMRLWRLENPKILILHTLPETTIAPENGWLEYDRFLLGFALFSGIYNLGSCILKKNAKDPNPYLVVGCWGGYLGVVRCWGGLPEGVVGCWEGYRKGIFL